MYKYILLFLLLTTPMAEVHAKWNKASSDHFVIYSEQSQSKLKDFAARLEKFHSAMELVSGVARTKVSPSNRVTIFVVWNQSQVRKLLGGNNDNVAGFYIPRAGGSVAFIPRPEKDRWEETSFSEVVLYHEYAHHFQFTTSQQSLPSWIVEGSAEFFASASFDKDGSVWVGKPAQHRGTEVFNAKKVPIELLLDPVAYAKQKKGNQYDAFYGQSWTLYHYLTLAELTKDPKRGDNMKRYLAALSEGQGYIEAAENAFGDLGKLKKELGSYLRQGKTQGLKLKAEWLPIGEINVSELSEGASEILPLWRQSRRGVNEEQAKELISKVRAIATKYKSDTFVQAALAEAEYDVGNDKEAIAAANRAIAIDEHNMNAHVQKIYASFRLSENVEEENAGLLWKQLSRNISAANKQEVDHPIPLQYFYRSYLAQGKRPTKAAVNALAQASGIAPYDGSLRIMLARQYMNDGKYDFARFTLTPLLSSSHASRAGALAKSLVEKINERTNETQDGDVVLD